MDTPSWVIVYEGGPADTGEVRDLLEAAGITVRLGDEVMGTMAPYILEGGTAAAIKVLVPEAQADAAAPIVAGFGDRSGGEASGAPAAQPWECPCCHERNDGSFDICWNCQTEKGE